MEEKYQGKMCGERDKKEKQENQKLFTQGSCFGLGLSAFTLDLPGCLPLHPLSIAGLSQGPKLGLEGWSPEGMLLLATRQALGVAGEQGQLSM